MSVRVPSLLVLGCLICLIAPVHAHVHGEAELDVAWEGTQVVLTLTAPGASLLAFEGGAQTAQQRAALEALRRAFSAPSRLFAVDAAARCTAAHVALNEPESAHSDHDIEPAAAQSHRAARSEHLAHDHEDWRFTLTLNCTNPDQIAELDLGGLFRDFAPLERVQVQLIGPGIQSGARASRDSPRVAWPRAASP